MEQAIKNCGNGDDTSLVINNCERIVNFAELYRTMVKYLRSKKNPCNISFGNIYTSGANLIINMYQNGQPIMPIKCSLSDQGQLTFFILTGHRKLHCSQFTGGKITHIAKIVIGEYVNHKHQLMAIRELMTLLALLVIKKNIVFKIVRNIGLYLCMASHMELLSAYIEIEKKKFQI